MALSKNRKRLLAVLAIGALAATLPATAFAAPGDPPDA